jgi:hypothetical protein
MDYHFFPHRGDKAAREGGLHILALQLRLSQTKVAKLRSGSFISLFYSFRRRHTVRFKTM